MLRINFEPGLVRDESGLTTPVVNTIISVTIPLEQFDQLIKQAKATGTMALMSSNANNENPPTPEQVEGEELHNAAIGDTGETIENAE